MLNHAESVLLSVAGPPIMHMGKCGLHGQTEGGAGCSEIDDQVAGFLIQEADRPAPDESWEIREVPQDLNRIGFSGWGGWGDRRDHKLCMFFAKLPEGLDPKRRL
jgi:alpha-1,6-mannosyl-glycoprotein beta-1,2-N-acetylglucosaminyltransferase